MKDEMKIAKEMIEEGGEKYFEFFYDLYENGKYKKLLKNSEFIAAHEAGHFFFSKIFGGDPEFTFEKNVPATHYNNVEKLNFDEFLCCLLAGKFCEYRYFHKFSWDDSIKWTFQDLFYLEMFFDFPEDNDLAKIKKYAEISAKFHNVDEPKSVILKMIVEIAERLYKNNKAFKEVLDEAREFYTKQVIWGRFNASPIFF